MDVSTDYHESYLCHFEIDVTNLILRSKLAETSTLFTSYASRVLLGHMIHPYFLEVLCAQSMKYWAASTLMVTPCHPPQTSYEDMNVPLANNRNCILPSLNKDGDIIHDSPSNEGDTNIHDLTGDE